MRKGRQAGEGKGQEGLRWQLLQHVSADRSTLMRTDTECQEAGLSTARGREMGRSCLCEVAHVDCKATWRRGNRGK